MNANNHNTNANQRNRILKRLRKGAATTLELRNEEDVLAPAARVYELRHKFGHNIKLDWVIIVTQSGHKHRVGRYNLLSNV